MNVLAAILIMLIVTIITGAMVFIIVRQTFAIKSSQTSISELNTSVAGIKGGIISDSTVTGQRLLLIGKAVAANQTQTDQDSVTANTQMTKFEDSLKTDVLSQRISFQTATVGAPLSLSTSAPTTASTSAPTDRQKWLQVTDKDSKNYANLGLGMLWADKGISMSQGACVNFGNSMSMCGDQGSVRILGALEVCDSAGATCVQIGPKTVSPAVTTAV